MVKLNKAQQVLARTYAGGDFAWCIEQADSYNKVAALVHNCGDSLFAFLMRELSEDADCDSVTEAISRVTSAAQQLEALTHELINVEGQD